MNNDTSEIFYVSILENAKAVRASLPDAGELQSASTAAQSLSDPTLLDYVVAGHPVPRTTLVEDPC